MLSVSTKARFLSADLPVVARENETALIQFAFSLLPQAAALAVVPVSNFRVGAAAIDAQGNIFLGANQEFQQVVLAQTIHAEQSAVANAWAYGAAQIKHIVVDTPPCGHCRQFLNELDGAATLRVHLPNCEPQYLRDYLPENFGPADLQIEQGLFAASSTVLCANVHTKLEQEALQWAMRSYAPYSGALAGFCLEDCFGGLHGGAYLENAAFNPSLPPLQMAINSLHLQGLSVREITQGCLVCAQDSGHIAHTQALWQALGAKPLSILAFEEQ